MRSRNARQIAFAIKIGQPLRCRKFSRNTNTSMSKPSHADLEWAWSHGSASRRLDLKPSTSAVGSISPLNRTSPVFGCTTGQLDICSTNSTSTFENFHDAAKLNPKADSNTTVPCQTIRSHRGKRSRTSETTRGFASASDPILRTITRLVTCICFYDGGTF